MLSSCFARRKVLASACMTIQTSFVPLTSTLRKAGFTLCAFCHDNNGSDKVCSEDRLTTANEGAADLTPTLLCRAPEGLRCPPPDSDFRRVRMATCIVHPPAHDTGCCAVHIQSLAISQPPVIHKSGRAQGHAVCVELYSLGGRRCAQHPPYSGREHTKHA